jgi:hypothetical protein
VAPSWTSPSSGPPGAVPPGAAPPAEPPIAPAWTATQQGWTSTQSGWTRPQALKPGVIPLRPIGVGELLDGAFTYIRRSPGVVLGISAIVAVVSNLVQLVFSLRLFSSAGTNSVLLNQNAGFSDLAPIFGQIIGGSFLTLLVTLVFQIIGTGMLTIVVTQSVLGRNVGWAQTWDRTKGSILALIGVTLLTTLLSIGGLLLCIVPGVILYVAWSIAVPALLVERCGIRESMRRSWRLTAGSRWRVFGILLLMQIIASFVAQIIASPFAVVGLLVDGLNFTAGSGIPVAVLVLSAIGGVVASTITLPFTAGVVALLYIDLRMRREGLDLQLAQAVTPRADGPSSNSPWTSA